MADQTGTKPAGWKRDPSGRHFGRYWDGEAWTEHVISAGKVQSVDPLQPTPEPSLFPDSPPPAPTPSAPLAQPPTTVPGWTPAPTKVAQSAAAPTEVLPASRADGRSALGAPLPPRPLPYRAWDGFRGWPRWAQLTVGVVLGLLIIGAATGGGEDDTPRPIVGEVATTLTLPVVSTTALASATTLPPVTQAPTTEATVPVTTRAPATTAATAPAATSAPAVSYANCAAVRAAGKAPLLRGQPGYTSGPSGLDRDNDGIACE